MDSLPWLRRTRQKVFFVTCCLVGTSIAQVDPLKGFCRRWGHQSAVVDRKLYIDGGLANYKPFGPTSQNITNTFLLYNDLDEVSQGMPPLYANLSKNATIPSVNGGILWEDSVNKRLYLYGGESYQTQPSEFTLYSYDILNDYWDSFGIPTGAGQINALSYGAGVSIPARGEAYSYGGWQSNASIPDWQGPPKASNRLLMYEMDSNAWSNLTGPDDIGRADGSMSFIPVGDAGMLVYFGGSQDLYGNGTLTPQPLDEIFLYDVANTKWYTQNASGNIPDVRRRFCGGATWAQDQSSYNIYIYGGLGFPPETTGYDDIYILTIPSFQWIRGPYPPGSNVSGPYPKNMMTCNVIDNSQMLVIGGTYSNDTTYMCDADTVWGTHNMNLGEENPENAIWALYQPNLTTYAVPTDIMTVVGGQNTGGAVVTTPTGGFDAPDLKVLMTRKAVMSTRKPTRSVPPTTAAATGPTPSQSDTGPSRGLSKGAIAGIAVGGAAVLALVVGACVFFILRRVKKRRHRLDSVAPPMQAQAQPPVTEVPVAYNPNAPQPPVHEQGNSGWDGTQVSSPTVTVMSQDYNQPAWPAGQPPAELATESGVHYVNSENGAHYDHHRSMSPTSAKFELGGAGNNGYQ